MAAALIRLLPRRQFDFSALPAGTSQKMIILERLDVSQHSDCIMVLRIHAASIAATNALSFDFYGDGFTENDPALDFRTASPLLFSQAIDSAVVAPYLRTSGATVRGHFATLLVAATKPAAGSLKATVSLDVILRNADEEEADDDA